MKPQLRFFSQRLGPPVPLAGFALAILLTWLPAWTPQPQAAAYAIDWSALGTSSGPATSSHYAMDGTLGLLQPSAADSPHYAIEGGFWPGVLSEVSPRLTIELAGKKVRIAWTPGLPGSSLQMKENLGTPAWSPAPSGTANPAEITIGAKPAFYRVIKP